MLIPFIYYCGVLTPLYMIYTPGQNPIEMEFEGRSFERFRLHVLPVLMLFTGLMMNSFLAGKPAKEEK
ncbi:MAG: hypothetical protein MJA29_01470 [Candidatus Omnitrophica bacterium]|nr:hypothetical protein [Candidatus Omnitrophota bacterium]